VTVRVKRFGILALIVAKSQRATLIFVKVQAEQMGRLLEPKLVRQSTRAVLFATRQLSS